MPFRTLPAAILPAMLLLAVLLLPAGAAGPPGDGHAYSNRITYLLDRSYGPLVPKNLYDVFLPDPDVFPGLRPCVVLLHGGGWTQGDKDVFYTKAPVAPLLAAYGFVAVSINYTLGGYGDFEQLQASCFQAVTDARAAIDFLRNDKVQEYAIDRNLIFTMGASSGATAAIHTPLGHELDTPMRRNMHYIAGIVSLWGCAQGLTGILYDDPGSPEHNLEIDWWDKNDPPVLAVVGSEDCIKPPPMSDAIVWGAREAGIMNREVLLQGAGHSCWDRWPEFMRETLGFLFDCLEE